MWVGEVPLSHDPRTILVIDDDPNVRLIVKEKFEPAGFRVLEASNEKEAFEKTRAERPDCVLLDVRIPEAEDGVSYLRKLRNFEHVDPGEQARMRETPVIVLTGIGTSVQSFFEFEGVEGFMEKPFDLVHLQNKVENVLRQAAQKKIRKNISGGKASG